MLQRVLRRLSRVMRVQVAEALVLLYGIIIWYYYMNVNIVQ